MFAAVTSPFWGPRIWYTDDLDGGDWQAASGVVLPKGGDEALKRIWVIVASDDGSRLWAGGDPGVLFESRDDGATWELNRALWEHPTRPRWRRDSGGLSVHSIAPWPGDPDRLALAISAAGVWLTDDGGATWRHGNEGIVADYLPEQAPRDRDRPLRAPPRARAAPRPSGCTCSSTAASIAPTTRAQSWIDIAAGLPSDFGFPVVTGSRRPRQRLRHPGRDRRPPDPGGRVLVWETRDAGATWTPHGDGLPQQDAYLQILRQAFAGHGEGGGLELYFGATSGEIFGSRDAGATWSQVARRLPTIASVRVGR